MVTSYKMNENDMGNRGSKSTIFNLEIIEKESSPKIVAGSFQFVVKEQRVDGSYFRPNQIQILGPKLRCILIETKQISLTIYLTKLKQGCVAAHI
jgi:hypothetical protein